MHDNRQNCFRFQFHHVLHNASQDAIYDGLARDIVQSAVDGISGEGSTSTPVSGHMRRLTLRCYMPTSSWSVEVPSAWLPRGTTNGDTTLFRD